MTIQIPNPGTGNGNTGDNEYVLWSKVKDNFNNSTHAASREVGETNGKLAEITTNGIAGAGWGGSLSVVGWNSLQTLQQNLTRAQLKNKGFAHKFSNQSTLVAELDTNSGLNAAGDMAGTFIQIGYDPATGYSKTLFSPYKSTRLLIGEAETGDLTSQVVWRHIVVDGDNKIYSKTTASGANLVVDSTGKLMRSTSSERYKDILADLELDDEAYANAMQLAPIVYRSTAEADNPDYHYYSFSAEKLGAFDPAFTLWRETETVTDDEGNTIEQPLPERVAEGININALLAFSHAIAIKQDKMIKVQAEAIETLTKRIDAITT